MENNKPNNPIAFPQDANTCLDEFRGMTLRDYFANSAMQGLVTFIRTKDIHDMESIVTRAYCLADLMLKERNL